MQKQRESKTKNAYKGPLWKNQTATKTPRPLRIPTKPQGHQEPARTPKGPSDPKDPKTLQGPPRIQELQGAHGPPMTPRPSKSPQGPQGPRNPKDPNQGPTTPRLQAPRARDPETFTGVGTSKNGCGGRRYDASMAAEAVATPQPEIYPMDLAPDIGYSPQDQNAKFVHNNDPFAMLPTSHSIMG